MALTAMTAEDWKESLDFSTQEVVPTNSAQFEMINSAQVGQKVVAYFNKQKSNTGWGAERNARGGCLFQKT